MCHPVQLTNISPEICPAIGVKLLSHRGLLASSALWLFIGKLPPRQSPNISLQTFRKLPAGCHQRWNQESECQDQDNKPQGSALSPLPFMLWRPFQGSHDKSGDSGWSVVSTDLVPAHQGWSGGTAVKQVCFFFLYREIVYQQHRIGSISDCQNSKMHGSKHWQ